MPARISRAINYVDEVSDSSLELAHTTHATLVPRLTAGDETMASHQFQNSESTRKFGTDGLPYARRQAGTHTSAVDIMTLGARSGLPQLNSPSDL